jgi:hypothetical protein
VSIPLKDYRTSINELTDVMLDAEAAAFGKDKQSIGREVLQEWARRKFHAHKVVAKRLAANGIQPELFGDDTEDAGTQRPDAKSPGSRR